MGVKPPVISITQMLFDGFATRDEVARLGYAKLSQYDIFKRSSEDVALVEAAAFLDTVKYQHLVQYAADTLKVHRQIHEQIPELRGAALDIAYQRSPGD